jgi:steroid delta-isomerase-like uncharacterized protein
VDHAASLRALYDRINAHDLEGFAELLSDDFVEHEQLPGLEPTKAGVKQFFAQWLGAFPDLRFEIADLITGADKAVARATFTGTQQGEFMGTAATGKSVTVAFIDILRFGDDGRAKEHWGVFDMLSMLQQLGAIPAPAGV